MAAWIAAFLSPCGLNAQGPARPVAEGRIETAIATVSTAQVGLGVQIPAGTYLRVALIGAVGRSWMADEHGRSSRLEAHARFHLDPFRESRYGLYGIGGAAATYDTFREWQERLVLGAGLELPSSGSATWAIEAAFAGGLRLTVLLRGVRNSRR